MHRIIAIFSLALVIGKASSLDAPIPGYGVQDIQWKVQAFPGGPMLNLNGTVQKVHSDLLKINPAYETDFPIPVTDGKRSPSLDKRFGPVCYTTSPSPPYGWTMAQTGYIQDGINHLRDVLGTATNGPGPGNCGRVSCSYKAAIWWCNDNSGSFTLPSYSTIADCAQVTVDACSTEVTIGGRTNAWVLGQNFNGYNWNCIVDGADC